MVLSSRPSGSLFRSPVGALRLTRRESVIATGNILDRNKSRNSLILGHAEKGCSRSVVLWGATSYRP